MAYSSEAPAALLGAAPTAAAVVKGAAGASTSGAPREMTAAAVASAVFSLSDEFVPGKGQAWVHLARGRMPPR